MEISIENDIILVGDFNLPPKEEAWDQVKAIPAITWLIRPPEKTSLGATALSKQYTYGSTLARLEYADIASVQFRHRDVRRTIS